MTVNEAIELFYRRIAVQNALGGLSSTEKAAIVLIHEIGRLRQENARLNDALGQVYSSTEDA